MSKTAIIYWSGTGNTEAMAKAILDGANSSGNETALFEVSQISADEAKEYDSLILGCPSMGAEVLEESEFEPFFTELEGNLDGKNIALFGSYGWGDGEWMRNWEERTKAAGAVLVNGEGLMINETPDDDGIKMCKEFGVKAASL